MTGDVLLQLGILTLGLVLLWGGAELLVRFSVHAAASLGISPMIIGLTVVSVGTSLPELFVSSTAAFQDESGIAIGNILGSNIANLGLILGIAALIRAMPVRRSWVTREVPFMMIVTLLFAAFALTGLQVDRIEGVVLLVIFAAFLVYLVRHSLREMAEFREVQELAQAAPPRGRMPFYLLMIVLGIAILSVGANQTVTAAVRLAAMLNVTNTVVGLTVIALGTSLPELATTIISAVRREEELAIGNIVGSNIANLALIGGVTALVRPMTMSEAILFPEMAMVVFITLLAWPFMRTDWRLIRGEGLALLAVYLLFIFLSASNATFHF